MNISTILKMTYSPTARPQTAKLLLMTFTYRVMGSIVEPPGPALMATLSPLEQQLFAKRWPVDFGGRPLEEGDQACPGATLPLRQKMTAMTARLVYKLLRNGSQ